MASGKHFGTIELQEPCPDALCAERDEAEVPLGIADGCYLRSLPVRFAIADPVIKDAPVPAA